MKQRLIFALLATFLIPSVWSRPVTYQRATSVLGQPDFTSSGSPSPVDDKSFVQPEAVVIEPVTGKVFVSDYQGNRILRFSSTAAHQTNASAEAVLGQADFDEVDPADPPTAASLNGPGGMAFDSQGNLYVADYSNRRILRWNNPTTIMSGAAADIVIGQADFTSKVDPGTGGAHSLFDGPWALGIDASDNLYLGDYDLHRVLRFADAPSLSGAAITASAVFGQPDLGSFDTGLDPGPGPLLTGGIFNYLWGLHIDTAGRLWVADNGNARVLRFDNAATKPSSSLPNAVLGQPDFASGGAGQGASRINNAFHLAMDAAGTLWLSDFGNFRVLGFKNAGTRPATGVNNANIVLGQPNFTAVAGSSINDRSFGRPYGIAVTPAGGLLVADGGADRVLHFRSENAALQASLRKQIAAAKKALKKAKKAGKKPLARKLAKKIKSLNAQLADAS